MNFNKSFKKFQEYTLPNTKNVFGGKGDCEDPTLDSSSSCIDEGQTALHQDWSDGVQYTQTDSNHL